jgi:beta-lactamase regulating signal transducer with metallopeptidase domain
MNALFPWLFDRGLAAGPFEGMVARISLVLAVAWLVHATLARTNPRWRVLAWRVASVAVLLVPAMTLWGPVISLALLPPKEPVHENTVAQATVPPANDRSPGESLEPRSEIIVQSLQPTVSFEPSVPQAAIHPPARANELAATGRQIVWLRLALSIWVVGIALGLVGEVSAWLQLRTLRRRSQLVCSEIISLGRTIAARLGYRRAFEIRRTRDLDSPCIVGVLWPVILVPEVDCLPSQRESLPAILSHETAHLLGFDLPWDGLLRVLARLLWFHPLMWRARSAHLAACDAVCDATAASFLGDVIGYGRVLAQLALRLSATNIVPALQMARPSSVRLRIEALHRRLYSARLARTAVTASIAAGLLLAVLCGVLSIARATADATDEGLSVAGRILNEHAKPIPRATVFVYSAGPRVGTSPYCPTCYVDCGKRATTDADGRFTIESLNSTLVFQLLAVAEGHRPQFIKDVDPQKGVSLEAKLAIRPIPNDPNRVVRGQVIDPHGRPAVGALVEAFGCKTAERRWWGRMDGVDPLVVTDERGEFALVCNAPVIGLDLRVEARGAARANFELVQSGNEKHRLELGLGATVKGRVLDRGRPLAGIAIGICQADRSAGRFLGPYQINTDDEGRFVLANLPSDGDLLVYGIMNAMKDGGALPVKKFNPASGAASDLGDLSTVPAHTLRGRIVLADGKPIPPQTRVMFSREEAWDSNFVAAAADGSFSIGGIPPEVIDVIVQVKGYRLSPKNKSFEPLNGSSIKGLMSGDVEDLVILYEPGETSRPDHDRNWQAAAEKRKRLRTQRLAGVTAALEEFPPEKVATSAPVKRTSRPLPKIVVPTKEPAPAPRENGGATKTLTGTVVDHHGQRVAKGRLWLPVKWLSQWETLTATGNYDGPDPFRLTFPAAWLPPDETKRNAIVWTYSAGHAIGTGNAYNQLFGVGPAEAFKIEVPPTGDLSFVVLLPDGKPAVGAKVEPLHFKTPQAYDLVPRELVELVAGTADAAGRAAMPALTRDGVLTINVKLAGFGTQQFRCDRKLTDPPEQTLRLRTVGRLEGRIAVDQLDLARGMVVSIETTDLVVAGDERRATGVAIVKVDDQGRFVIPQIANGRVAVMAQCDERLPVRARLPKNGALTLLAGETGTIEIPLEMAVRVHGAVRAKDTQKPLAGVTVAVRYGVGQQGDYAVTDEKGEYSALALAGEVYVHLISVPNEYLQLGAPWNERRTVPVDAKEFTWPTIDVVPSIKISGKLVDHEGKPMANMRINGITANRRYGFGNSDKNGAFTLQGVPKGVQLDKFEIWTRDEHFAGVVETKEPLLVRVQK